MMATKGVEKNKLAVKKVFSKAAENEERKLSNKNGKKTNTNAPHACVSNADKSSKNSERKRRDIKNQLYVSSLYIDDDPESLVPKVILMPVDSIQPPEPYERIGPVVELKQEVDDQEVDDEEVDDEEPVEEEDALQISLKEVLPETPVKEKKFARRLSNREMLSKTSRIETGRHLLPCKALERRKSVAEPLRPLARRPSTRRKSNIEGTHLNKCAQLNEATNEEAQRKAATNDIFDDTKQPLTSTNVVEQTNTEHRPEGITKASETRKSIEISPKPKKTIPMSNDSMVPMTVPRESINIPAPTLRAENLRTYSRPEKKYLPKESKLALQMPHPVKLGGRVEENNTLTEASRENHLLASNSWESVRSESDRVPFLPNQTNYQHQEWNRPRVPAEFPQSQNANQFHQYPHIAGYRSLNSEFRRLIDGRERTPPILGIQHFNQHDIQNRIARSTRYLSDPSLPNMSINGGMGHAFLGNVNLHNSNILHQNVLRPNNNGIKYNDGNVNPNVYGNYQGAPTCSAFNNVKRTRKRKHLDIQESSKRKQTCVAANNEHQCENYSEFLVHNQPLYSTGPPINLNTTSQNFNYAPTPNDRYVPVRYPVPNENEEFINKDAYKTANAIHESRLSNNTRTNEPNCKALPPLYNNPDPNIQDQSNHHHLLPRTPNEDVSITPVTEGSSRGPNCKSREVERPSVVIFRANRSTAIRDSPSGNNTTSDIPSKSTICKNISSIVDDGFTNKQSPLQTSPSWKGSHECGENKNVQNHSAPINALTIVAKLSKQGIANERQLDNTNLFTGPPCNRLCTSTGSKISKISSNELANHHEINSSRTQEKSYANGIIKPSQLKLASFYGTNHKSLPSQQDGERIFGSISPNKSPRATASKCDSLDLQYKGIGNLNIYDSSVSETQSDASNFKMKNSNKMGFNSVINGVSSPSYKGECSPNLCSKNNGIPQSSNHLVRSGRNGSPFFLNTCHELTSLNGFEKILKDKVLSDDKEENAVGEPSDTPVITSNIVWRDPNNKIQKDELPTLSPISNFMTGPNMSRKESPSRNSQLLNNCHTSNSSLPGVPVHHPEASPTTSPVADKINFSHTRPNSKSPHAFKNHLLKGEESSTSVPNSPSFEKQFPAPNPIANSVDNSSDTPNFNILRSRIEGADLNLSRSDPVTKPICSPKPSDSVLNESSGTSRVKVSTAAPGTILFSTKSEYGPNIPKVLTNDPNCNFEIKSKAPSLNVDTLMDRIVTPPTTTSPLSSLPSPELKPTKSTLGKKMNESTSSVQKLRPLRPKPTPTEVASLSPQPMHLSNFANNEPSTLDQIFNVKSPKNSPSAVVNVGERNKEGTVPKIVPIIKTNPPESNSVTLNSNNLQGRSNSRYFRPLECVSNLDCFDSNVREISSSELRKRASKRRLSSVVKKNRFEVYNNAKMPLPMPFLRARNNSIVSNLPSTNCASQTAPQEASPVGTKEKELSKTTEKTDNSLQKLNGNSSNGESDSGKEKVLGSSVNVGVIEKKAPAANVRGNLSSTNDESVISHESKINDTVQTATEELESVAKFVEIIEISDESDDEILDLSMPSSNRKKENYSCEEEIPPSYIAKGGSVIQPSVVQSVHFQNSFKQFIATSSNKLKEDEIACVDGRCSISIKEGLVSKVPLNSSFFQGMLARLYAKEEQKSDFEKREQLIICLSLHHVTIARGDSEDLTSKTINKNKCIYVFSLPELFTESKENSNIYPRIQVECEEDIMPLAVVKSSVLAALSRSINNLDEFNSENVSVDSKPNLAFLSGSLRLREVEEKATKRRLFVFRGSNSNKDDNGEIEDLKGTENCNKNGLSMKKRVADQLSDILQSFVTAAYIFRYEKYVNFLNKQKQGSGQIGEKSSSSCSAKGSTEVVPTTNDKIAIVSAEESTADVKEPSRHGEDNVSLKSPITSPTRIEIDNELGYLTDTPLDNAEYPKSTATSPRTGQSSNSEASSKDVSATNQIKKKAKLASVARKTSTSQWTNKPAMVSDVSLNPSFKVPNQNYVSSGVIEILQPTPTETLISLTQHPESSSKITNELKPVIHQNILLSHPNHPKARSRSKKKQSNCVSAQQSYGANYSSCQNQTGVPHREAYDLAYQNYATNPLQTQTYGQIQEQPKSLQIQMEMNHQFEQKRQILSMEQLLSKLNKSDLLTPSQYCEDVVTLYTNNCPLEFFNFYNFITKRQVLVNENPISFRLFLQLQNAGKLKYIADEYRIYYDKHEKDRLTILKNYL